MSTEDLTIAPTGNSNLLAKQCDSTAAVKKSENRSDIRDSKNVNEYSERAGKKRETSIKRKDMERLNRIHLRRGGGYTVKSQTKVQKQEVPQSRYSNSSNLSQEDVTDVNISKKAKKNPDEVVYTSRFKRKTKEVEKSPDSKINSEKTKKPGNKTKAVTAFGTTFHKSESEQPPLPKRRLSSSVDRFGRSKRSKSKDAITEETGDEPRKDPSQSQLRPSTKQSGLKMSLSKNKLTEMLEEGNKEKSKIRGAFESATGKRARSPYHTSSKLDAKKPSSKVRMEGDSKNTGGKQDDKAEIGKDLSFFEKIQQNVRAYFSQKPSEITKFQEEEKKKVQEGEYPENDENIMIRKDERIKRGFKEDFMKGDQDFLIYIEKEKKSDLDKSCKTITKEYFPGQKSAKGNGSGPGGKIAYSNGDIYIHSNDYQYKRPYYIKRRNECTEKPRTGSFHRSKTFQKNGLAPSTPKSSTSIGLILEPDEQVENISSADGMASAFTQIQELHQEINPNVIERRMNYARGTKSVSEQEDNLTSNRLPVEITTEEMKSCRKSGRSSSLLRRIGSLRKRNVVIVRSRSTTYIRGCDITIGNRTKSEGTIQHSPSIHSIFLHKDFPYRTLSNEKTKPTAKQEKVAFIPVQRQWHVYSVTETKSIQTTRSESLPAELNSNNTEETDTRSKCKSTKIFPIKTSAAVGNVEEEPPSVSLKEIINLSRKIFLESPEKVAENIDPVHSLRNEGDDNLTLSYCLEKLMEEKKNYLNLEKTKNFRKEQKANFISDSFNFFNLLNKEFLSLKSSNPRIEELRNVIGQKKEPQLEEYLDMYKRVIRTSLTEPEQYLMDKAKQKLERYTDMYYDLMKYICLEKEGNNATSLPSDKSSQKVNDKINYEELLKSKVGTNMKTWGKYSEKVKSRTEKPYFSTKMPDNRRNRDSSNGGNCYIRNNFKRNGRVDGVHEKDHKIQDSKTKPVVELLSPQKNKGSQRETEGRKNQKAKKEDPASRGKVFLSISLCDDGLLISHTEDESKDDSNGQKKDKPSLSLKGEKCDSFGTDPESSRICTSQSERVKSESDVTVYAKSSIDENNSSENQKEQSILKFCKLLGESIKYVKLLNETESKFEQQEKCGKGFEQVPKSLNTNLKTHVKVNKRSSDYPKSIRKSKYGGDSFIYSTREGKMKKYLRKKKSGYFSRPVSSYKKEDTTKIPWWRNDNFALANAGAGKPRKVSPARKVENCKVMNRNLPETTKEISSKEEKKKRKTESAEEDSSESASEFITPPGSFFEWPFGKKDVEELLQDTPSKMLNPGGLSEGRIMYPYQENEQRELQRSDLPSGDKKGEDTLEEVPSLCTGQKTSLRLGFHNPLKAEWMEEASSQKDYQKVTDVLNQFMGNVAEAWKAAACLKDLIQPTTSKVEEVHASKAPEPGEENGGQLLKKNKTIDSFKNFLRILTKIFEDDEREESVRKELSLLRNEFVKHSDKELSAPPFEVGGRTRFAQEIAEIPREVREMIASELMSYDGESENNEPVFFVAAIKKVGEKLKDIYLWDEGEGQNERQRNEYCEPKKIYYRPPKKLSQEGKKELAIKSNLGNLAEKLGKMYKEKKIQESANEKPSVKGNACLDTHSSVYFDAKDTFQHAGSALRKTIVSDVGNIEKVTLSPIDESYFSLSGNKFGKYRDAIYDKIIAFLRSDNQRTINYGMALLRRMIDRDGHCPKRVGKISSGVKDEREKKWQDLLDKLMETCQVIEAEVREQVEKCTLEPEDSEKKMEIGRTFELLKGYVDKMKLLMQGMKSPNEQCRTDDSVQHIKALDNSRETNKERQLVTPDTKCPAKQKFLLDNAMDFINSIGNIGYSFDKFPFFPKCFAGSASGKRVRPELDTSQNEVRNVLLLEGNKTIVKSLRKNIEKRQRKIKDMIEEAGKEGVTREESLQNQKIMQKVRDLKKCYLLLEKMICDPTLLPPKWLKLDEPDEKLWKNRKYTGNEESPAMSMLEDLLKQVSDEQKILRYSRSSISAHSKNTEFRSPASVGSLTLVKINYATVNFECPAQSKENVKMDAEEEKENGVPQRPITA